MVGTARSTRPLVRRGDAHLGREGEGIVTENERRAEDLLERRDLVVRGLVAFGLIAATLVALIAG